MKLEWKKETKIQCSRQIIGWFRTFSPHTKNQNIPKKKRAMCFFLTPVSRLLGDRNRKLQELTFHNQKIWNIKWLSSITWHCKDIWKKLTCSWKRKLDVERRIPLAKLCILLSFQSSFEPKSQKSSGLFFFIQFKWNERLQEMMTYFLDFV